MDESTVISPCKECKDGVDESQLRTELEHLRQHIAERDVHFLALENEFYKCTSRANDLEEQLDTWREKYERLYDSHKRVQKLNQVLEDKLLQMVDKMKSEKSQLTKDIATLSVRLAESKHNYSMLQKENERYKNDMNLAIQLLQCKPDNFVAQKLDNLPMDTQARVSQYVMSKTSKPGILTPGKNGNDTETFDASEYEFNISASLMTKILEDSIQDTVTKHCDTCTCGKSQNKPFCYNESYYTMSTQTILSGDFNPLCQNCSSEIKSMHSNYSTRSISPHAMKFVSDKIPIQGPMYIPTQPIIEEQKENLDVDRGIVKTNVTVIDLLKPVESIQLDANAPKELVPKPEDEIKQFKNNYPVTLEPSIHHKLCDHTKNSISSKKSSIPSICNEDLLTKEIPIDKEVKTKSQPVSVTVSENLNVRKNSHSSMGGSRTSSVAKSTISTHKSNNHVGPGPRFCHLRMQAGSKNILLDNAEPDVPPVLYRRQSKCNENSIFKDLNDGMENYINLVKTDDDLKNDNKNDNIVVESTLIDVHEDNNNKEASTSIKSTSINPILLNVSSSPLQPLKTHNFSNSSEQNNNNTQSIGSQQNPSDIDHLLNDFNIDVNVQNNNVDHSKVDTKKTEVFNDLQEVKVFNNDQQEVKIFNFDRYEQSKVASQFARPLKKIDMSQLHSIENTKISKDLPPLGVLPNIEKKPDPPKPLIPAIVNVYPNLTQTHLKVNENNKVFTNEQSTSSLSSDDSAALLQKQQLLRVAEWVEKNLEQQNNFNDPLEDDCTYTNRALRRDSKLSRLTETLNELALNMPHPVSKYSKYGREPRNNYVHQASSNNNTQERTAKTSASHTKVINNVVKETIFPVECNDLPITEVNHENVHMNNSVDANNFDPGKELKEALKGKGDKEISPEDLARMEYNVKKFLLSGPHWVNPGSVGRSRRTSSKTETDV